MPEAFAAGAVDTQQLTTPQATIGAKANAVNRQPKQRFVYAMFGANGRDVRVVMANGDGRHIELGSKTQGQVSRGKIGM
jgi:hypothetical protein